MNRLVLERRCKSLRSEAHCSWFFPTCAWDDYGCYWSPCNDRKFVSDMVPSNGTRASSPSDLCGGLTPWQYYVSFFFMYILCTLLKYLIKNYGWRVMRFVGSVFCPTKCATKGKALAEPDLLEAQKLPSP